MPNNPNQPSMKMHTTKKFGRPSSMEFKEQLCAIDVQIHNAPTIEQFRKTISVFMMNTWNDRLQTEFSDEEIDTCIRELFAGNILPTGMETIGITWSVSGMNMVDTTHLIRHRLFSFSAQTHADRDMRDDDVLVPAAIIANREFLERFIQLNRDAMNLYTDMMDSGKVHCLDARLVMPRSFEHFYITRCCIKDLIGFCKMRGDEQIQTAADNVIAMKLWLEVLKLYPFLKGIVDFDLQDDFYVRQCIEGKTNIFPPNKKNDVFDWSEGQFFHNKHRDSYPGAEAYLSIRERLINEINAI